MSLPVKKQTDFEEDIAGISAFVSTDCHGYCTFCVISTA